MRIAVTYKNGSIFGHFGHCAQFRLYDIEDGIIANEQTVDAEGFGHGALTGFLAALKTDVLICGGIGAGARIALEEAGIKLCPGMTGSADEAVKAYIAGTLDYDPEAHCDHHEHHGGCEHDNCAEHQCSGSCH